MFFSILSHLFKNVTHEHRVTEMPTTAEFNCFIENKENPTGKALSVMKTRELEYWLRKKYVDLCLFDEGKGTDGGASFYRPLCPHRRCPIHAA